MSLYQTPVPTGSEFRVSKPAKWGLHEPEIAGLADGTFVVTWLGPEASGAGPNDIYARQYAADGTPIGGEFRVNAGGDGDQFRQEVAALGDGGFVVTWTAFPRVNSKNDVGRPPRDVHAQRFDSDGAPVGTEIVINTEIVSQSAVAALSDGGFVVAWSDSSGSGANVHAQLFSANGAPTGIGLRANDETSGGRGGASVAALADGGFVLTWSSEDGPGTRNGDIHARRFGADGSPVGAEFGVHDPAAGDQRRASVANLADGGFVVVWEGSPETNFYARIKASDRQQGTYDIHARRFGADGSPVGAEFRVHDAAAGDQTGAKVAALADGGFLVTWDSASPSTFQGGTVHARRFAADGSPAGGEFSVQGAPGDTQRSPDVAALANGDFAVTWSHWYRAAGPAGAIFTDMYARVFELPPSREEVRVTAGASPQTEGGVGAGATFAFDVTLDAAASAPLSVRWRVEGSGPRAADAADFEGGVLPSGDLVFAAGETRKTVAVRIAGDVLVEADEGFAVSLWAVSDGLAIGSAGSAAAAILDDDLLASAPPAHAAQVVRLYEAALDRLPDRDGFAFWVDALGKGAALPSLAGGFLASPEFASRFGGASADDGAFVERLYRNVLGRAGEAEGRAFWDDSLGKGCSRAEVLAAFSESAEHVALASARLGDGSGLLIA